jgi:putative two-component system response regulator
MATTNAAGARILVITKDAAARRELEEVLRHVGAGEVRGVEDSRLALPAFREHRPDLVVVEMGMPHLDGAAVVRQLFTRAGLPGWLPFVFVAAAGETDAVQRALEVGAADVLVRPFDAAEVVLRVRNLLRLRHEQAALYRRLEDTLGELQRARIEMAERLAVLAEYRHAEGPAGPAHVGVLAAQIAEELGLPEEEVTLLRYAAPLHDVGMVALPQILAKDGLLTLEELDSLKTHTSIGARILASSESPILRLAEEIALYHHENWDGTGYTPGLEGEAIPLVARIVAVADTYDAMRRERSYHAAHTEPEAAAWIESQAGRKFDPAVVAAFMRVRQGAELPLLDAAP